MGSVGRFGFAAAVLAALACAQRAPTGRVFGVLRTEDGAAWGRATVELLARPVPDDETVGVAEHVVVESDADGRFRAEVRSTRRFSAFAWSPLEGGAYRVSGVIDGVVAGDPVVLTRTAAVRHRRSIRLAPEPGVALPLRAVARAATGNVFVVPLPFDGDRRATLPPLPPVPIQVEVYRADGLPLARRSVDPGSGLEERIDVPIPARVRVSVRDIADGAPPAGAFVFAQLGAHRVRVGMLDERAEGECDVPAFGALFAGAPGRGVAALDPRGAAQHLRTAVAHVGAANLVRGRVMIAGDRPAAGAWLLVHGASMTFAGPDHRSLQHLRDAIELDGDGRFELDGVFDGQPPSVDLLLSPEQLAALPGVGRARPSAIVPFAIDPLAGSRAPDGSIDLAEVRLFEFVPIRLAVTAPDGAPAIGAQLRIVDPARHQDAVGSHRVEVGLDRTGSGTVLLRAGTRLLASIETRAGVVDWILLFGNRPSRDVVTARIEMREPISIRGQILREGGGPVRRCPLMVRPEFGDGPPNAVAPPNAEHDVTARLVGSADGAPILAVALDVEWFRAPGHADDEGRFAVAVPRFALRYVVSGPGFASGIDVDPAADPAPLRIEIAR